MWWIKNQDYNGPIDPMVDSSIIMIGIVSQEVINEIFKEEENGTINSTTNSNTIKSKVSN